jgi:hypothetical protein
MAKYTIAWLPGNGVSVSKEVLEAADVASKTHSEFPTTATAASRHLKIGFERIRAGANDIDGFQHFIQKGKHLC